MIGVAALDAHAGLVRGDDGCAAQGGQGPVATGTGALAPDGASSSSRPG
jgi:hypothetical protein